MEAAMQTMRFRPLAINDDNKFLAKDLQCYSFKNFVKTFLNIKILVVY